MTKTHEIRCFVRDQYIDPARAAGVETFEVHARDVARGMTLSNRFPLICSALDLKSWREEAGIELVDRRGPSASSTVVWRFRLGRSSGEVVDLASHREDVTDYGLAALESVRAEVARAVAKLEEPTRERLHLGERVRRLVEAKRMPELSGKLIHLHCRARNRALYDGGEVDAVEAEQLRHIGEAIRIWVRAADPLQAAYASPVAIGTSSESPHSAQEPS